MNAPFPSWAMLTRIVSLLLLGGLACYGDLFKFTGLTVTGETRNTGTVFIGASGDAPSNLADKTLWSLVVSDGDKIHQSIPVASAVWDAATNTITLAFAPSALGALDPLKVAWTATFSNLLQVTSEPRSSSFFSKADGKDDADLYLFGSFLAGYSTKPLYTIDAKVSWAPEIRSSGYMLGVIGTLSTNADASPPVDRSRVDPDSITAALVLRHRIRQFSFDLHPLEGQFSRQYPASDLITSGTVKWVAPAIKRQTRAVVFYPFIGYELGKNLNKPGILFSQPVDLGKYDNIERLLLGAHGAFLLFKKTVPAESPYRLVVQSDYTARALFSAEPYVTSGYSDAGRVSIVRVRGNTRHYLECGVTFNVSDFFGIEAKYKFGSLPPLFESVEHQVVVGLTFKAKLPR